MKPVLLLTLLVALAGCGGLGALDGRTAFTSRPSSQLVPVDPSRVQQVVESARDDEDAHYFRFETTREHVFGFPEVATWTFLEDVRGQYVVLDPDEERLTTFRMTLPRRARIEDGFFRATSPAGVVETFTTADLIEERDGDDVTYKLAYRAIEKGSVIEEAFRIRYEWADDYSPPLYHDVRLQQSFATDTLVARYIGPSTWGMTLKRIAPGEYPPLEIAALKDGRRVLDITLTDQAGFPDEPYAPYFKEVAPYWEFAINRINLIGGRPPLYEAPDTWEKLAGNIKDYAFKRGGVFSDPVRRKLGEIVDASASDSAKVAQITTWVQSNIEPGDEARNLGDVLKTGRGNLYQITGLAQALLDEAGVETSFLMIHPRSEGHFDPSFVHAGQFVEPAVLARVPGNDYILFPYVDGLPFSYIPEPYQGVTAMRIDSDGFDGFISLPQPRAQSYATDVRYEIEIDEDGVVHVDETAVLRGFAAFAMRKRFEDLTPDERTTEARELLTYTETEVDAFTYELQDEDDANAPLGVRLTYTIDDLVTVTPEEAIFQTGGLLSPASLRSFSVDVRERQLPIRIYNDELTTKRVSIRFPDSWTLSTPLDGVNERNGFGQAFANYTVTPGEILGMQRIRLNASEAPSTEYRALLDITGASSKLYVPTLVFSTAAPSPTAAAGE